MILRSGQPLPGPNGKRCKEDESLLNSTLGIGKRGYIIDTRSYNSAVNSRSKGERAGLKTDTKLCMDTRNRDIYFLFLRQA